MIIKDFNIEEALNGASIGFITGVKVDQYIIDFKSSGSGRTSTEYVGIGQTSNKKYYFNNKGQCSDGLIAHSLKRIEDKISFTTGTVASRGETEGAEMISIENMQPRELFAQTAMQSIISKIEEPILGIDDFKITKICELSFKIAQKMLTTAAEYRAETKEDTNDNIEIDKNTLTSATDKLLYNIQESLKNLSDIKTDIKVISDNSTYNKDNGIKAEISISDNSDYTPVLVNNQE